jgi:hypothetical protein
MQNPSSVQCSSTRQANTTSMKMRAFCDMEPFNLVEVDRRFTNGYCIHHRGYYHRPDPVGSMRIWNIGLQDATSQKAVTFIVVAVRNLSFESVNRFFTYWFNWQRQTRKSDDTGSTFLGTDREKLKVWEINCQCKNLKSGYKCSF